MANLTCEDTAASEAALGQLSDNVFNLGRLIRARDERRPECFRIDEAVQAIAGPHILARLRARRPARDPRADCASFATQWDFPRSL